MNLLILHQNFPGQFKLLARALSERPDWRVVGLAQRGRTQNVIPSARFDTYPFTGPPTRVIPPLLQFEDQVRRGQAVKLKLLELRASGFVPDIVLAHPGWGEALFVHDVYPGAALVAYLEFFYAAAGRDTDFDPEFASSMPDLAILKLRNLSSLIAFTEAETCITPTRWQASLFPPSIRNHVRIVHEGIDTDVVAPDPSARFTLPDGRVLDRSRTVITYVARSLEPYRGFHRFMRALPALLARCPEAQVVLVGGDLPSYGQAPHDMPNWREKLLAELGDRLDLSRLTFIAALPYERYLDLLRVSTVHVYLTYPFVLSWSLVEAMASGCAIVGSRTPPVEEAIAHGVSGDLVGFFDEDALVEAVAELAADPARRAAYGAAARARAREAYDFTSVALPAYLTILGEAKR